MEISIPKESLAKLGKPIDKGGAGGGGGAPTPEEQEAARIEAEKKAAEEAAAKAGGGGGTPPDIGAGGGGGETPPDLSLLEAADKTLVSELETLLSKEDGTLTEEEQKKIDANLELVKAIANQEVDPIYQLMAEEGYIEEGEFGQGIDGFKGYLQARDEKRDATVVSQFLDERPELKALAEHLKAKKPMETFLAQVQKPAILNAQIVQITDSMTDAQKETAKAQQIQIIEANLRANRVSEDIIKSVVKSTEADGNLYDTAKSSLESLNGLYEAEIRRVEEQAAAKAQQDAKDAQDTLDKTVGIIKSGKLTDSISIPKSDEANFIKFISQPVNDRGQTMADIKYGELTLEQRTAIDYIVFKGLKIPSMNKSSVMNKYKMAKKQNDDRKTPAPTTVVAGKGIGKLNLRALAEEKNFI